MAKSRGRKFAELVAPTNGVFAAASIPTIALSKLASSAVTINSESLSLGGSLTLDTSDIGEHTSNKYFTDTRAQATLSVASNSGHGALAYDNSNGEFTFAGITTEAIQDVVGAMFSSNTETAVTVTYEDSDGTIDLVVDDTTKVPLAGGTMTGNLTLGDNVNAYFGASTDLRIYHDGTNSHIINSTGELRVTGSNIAIKSDSAKLYFGASDDLQIYHDGSHSFISDQGTGHLKLLAGDFRLNNAADNAQMISAVSGGSVYLYDNNSLKLQTSSTGVSVSGHIDLDDNNMIKLGTGNDFEIYFNGTHGVIRTASSSVTGNIYIQDDNNIVLGSIGGENYLNAAKDGAVTLYYDNSAKLATTSTGVQTTGTLNVNGAFAFPTSDGSANQILQTNGSGVLSWVTNSGGSSQWTASGSNIYYTSGNVGIGKSSGLTYLLELEGAIGDGTPMIRGTITGTPANGFNWATEFISANLAAGRRVVHVFGRARSSGAAGHISYYESTVDDNNNQVQLGMYGANDILNVTYNRRVGINTSTPANPLHINDSDDQKIILSGSADPYIRWQEGTTNKAYMQWNAAGYLELRNQEDSSGIKVDSGLTITPSSDEAIVLQGRNDPYIRFQEQTTNKAYIQWNAAGYLTLANQEDASSLRIKDALDFTLDGSTYHSIWHAGNDGAGSGLDADTLDGQQGSYYAPTASPTFTGTVTLPTGVNGTAHDSSMTNVSNGWHTVASFSGARSNSIIEVWDNVSSRHNYAKVEVVWSYGNVSINVVSASRHGTHTIQYFRLMRNTADQTYGGARLEVYLGNWTTSYTIYARKISRKGKTGWGDATVSFASGTASGYQVYGNSVAVGSQIQGTIATTGAVHAPYMYATRSDGNTNNGYFYSDTAGRTAFGGGDFYIQNSVSNYYNYATNQYIGDSSGDNIYFRGNTISGNGWSLTGAGVLDLNGGHGALNITSSSILSSASSTWTGDPGADLKIQAHSNRWYIVADSSSNRIVQFRRNGTDNSYIDNAGRLLNQADSRGVVFYDESDTTYYLDPNASGTSMRTAGSWRQNSTNWTGEIPGKIQYHSNQWYFQSTDGVFNFRNSSGGNLIYSDTSGNLFGSVSTRSPVFYDSGNTAYYVDPTATSRLVDLKPNRISTQQNIAYGMPRWDFKCYVMESPHHYADSSTATMYLGEDNTINIRDHGIGEDDLRAPIFYHSTNTAYFVRPGNTSKFADDIFIDGNYGKGIVGVYSSTRYQHVWMMGSAYRTSADGTSYGNAYGITWTHTNIGTGTNQSISGLSHQMQIRANGTLWCAMGQGIWTTGNVTAYSDIAVKTNLEVIPNALEKVCSISGYTYDRTDFVPDPETGEMPETRQAGVVAQEVEKVLPEVVSGEEGNKNVAYGNMVSILIEAIKELKTEVDELKAQLNKEK